MSFEEPCLLGSSGRPWCAGPSRRNTTVLLRCYLAAGRLVRRRSSLEARKDGFRASRRPRVGEKIRDTCSVGLSAAGITCTNVRPTGLISISAGASTARAMLRSSWHSSPWILSAATPSLGATERNQLEEGWQEVRPPVCYQRVGLPDADARKSRFEGSQQPVRPPRSSKVLSSATNALKAALKGTGR
jgi:hypothetical protein